MHKNVLLNGEPCAINVSTITQHIVRSMEFWRSIVQVHFAKQMLFRFNYVTKKGIYKCELIFSYGLCFFMRCSAENW